MKPMEIELGINQDLALIPLVGYVQMQLFPGLRINLIKLDTAVRGNIKYVPASPCIIVL